MWMFWLVEGWEVRDEDDDEPGDSVVAETVVDVAAGKLGPSKTSHFCLSARRHRSDNRCVRGVSEDLRTELRPQPGKKCNFRDAQW